MACMSSRRDIGVFVFLHCLWCCFVLLILPCASALFALRSCLCYFSHSSGIICRFVSCADRVVSPTSSRTPCCCCNCFVASMFSAIQFSLYGIYIVGSSLSSVFSPRCSLHGRDVCIPRGTHIGLCRLAVVLVSWSISSVLREAGYAPTFEFPFFSFVVEAGFSRLVLPFISC